jgi:hypothetical protein
MSSPEVGRSAQRWARALVAALILLAMHGGSVAQGAPEPAASSAIGLPAETPAAHGNSNPNAVARLAVSDQRRHGLAQAIAASARVSLVDAGVETAKQALLDCQKEALQGGGAGALGMPMGRPGLRTDHCFR